MLTELRLRNLAVIEEVTVPFGPGLNVLSGETGAGKSIVIDALLLIIGARAQPDLIRSGAESAVVEAVFEPAPGSPVAGILEAAGHALLGGQLVIKREMARAGRHRVFVNDAPATGGLPARVEEIDERRDALAKLRRKYGDTVAAMRAYREEIAGVLDRLDRHEELAAALERRLGELAQDAASEALALSEARAEAAGRLERLIQKELRGLGMEHARFRVAVRHDPAGPEELGCGEAGGGVGAGGA